MKLGFKDSLFSLPILTPAFAVCSADLAEGLDRAVNGAVSLPEAIGKEIGKFVQWSQPYQPYAAGIKIIGTIGWKKYTARSIQKKIDLTGCAIEILKEQARANILPKEETDKKILKLREQRRELRLNQKNYSISFLDLPCLLFDHPGSNAWKSCTSLAERVCSLCHHATPMKRKPLCNAPVTSIAQIGLGTFSLLGTGVTLLKQFGAIDGTDMLSQGLVGTAFAIQGIESFIMAKNTICSFASKKMIARGWIKTPQTDSNSPHSPSSPSSPHSPSTKR